ncbi:MAG: AEC family transporter [Kyrpidia tusciae]|nr:AEC family transporter [Kyrpidia tusciae]MBE3551956.1 AEC family transporter [Kyrpidia tusciae]
MSGYLSTMVEVSLPILLAVLGGAWLDRSRRLDTRSLAEVSLYLLAPSLVLFALPEGSGGGGEIGAIAAFTLLNTGLMWLVGEGAGRWLGLGRAGRSALSMTSVFGNSNNYGLPVVLLAYGTAGFSRAAVYVVGQILLMYTLGIYLASRATAGGKGTWQAVFRMPVLYAAVVGGAVAFLGLGWPKGVNEALHLLGNAYPAVVLLILGVQLGRANWRGIGGKELWMAILIRLVGAPAVAFFCLWILHIDGLLASVLFVEASMPAAVNTAVLVEQFGGDRELVAKTVAVTTAASFVLLPVFVVIGRSL